MDIVTGSTGCLGNVLLRELEKRNKKVKTLIRSTSDTCAIEDCCSERVHGDLLDLDSLCRAFDGVETVYHLAAEVTIMPGKDRHIKDTNYLGTLNVIDACKKTGVKKLVFTSSIHALKEPGKNILMDETLPFDLYSRKGSYDRSKAWASKAVVEAAGQDLETFVLCPTAIIGPYDFRISHLGQFFIDYCNARMSFIVDGAYDFVDVRDVALGHISACEKGRSGNVYILSGHKLTLEKLVTILEKLTGVPKPKHKIPTWLAYLASFFTPVYYRLTGKKPRFTKYSIMTINSNSNISSKKARKELGYSPRDIEESIRDCLLWFSRKNIIRQKI